MKELTKIQKANLSPGYRKFRRMFKCQCIKCGSKACATSVAFIKPRFILKRIGKARVGFKCIRCEAVWWHVITLDTLHEELFRVKK